MTATYQNYEGREAFPTVEIECYIQKPVEIKDFKKDRRSVRIVAMMMVGLVIPHHHHH
jgi:hypothetical protein